MTLTAPSKPALNKQGLAKITFKYYEDVEPKTDPKTGEEKSGYSKLCFEIMDTTRRDPIKTNIIGASLSGRFLQAIEALGFVPPKLEHTYDKDGFSLELGILGDDGFEIEEVTAKDDLVNQVREFLLDNEGIVLYGKVSRTCRGYWEIDIDSLILEELA